MNYMCRLCLSDNGIMEPIFIDQNKVLLDRICELTSIKIKNVDGWPASICEDCKSKLIISVTFKKLCINTQNTILEQLGLPETNEDNNSDDNAVVCLENEKIEKEDDVIEILDSSDDDESKHSNISDEEMGNYSESRKSSRIKKKSKKNYFEEDSSEEVLTVVPKKIRDRRCSVKVVNYNEETDLTNNNIQARLECTICHFICKTKLLLQEHRLVHSQLRQYQCDDCPRCFKFISQLKQHEFYHLLRKYTCNRCKKKFKYHKELNGHKMTCL